MITLFLCVVLVAWICVFRYKRRHMYKLAEKIEGPDEEIPIFGVAHTLSGSTEDIMKMLQHYSYASMKKDGVLKGWLGHILYFVVVNPMDLEVVLKTCLEKDNLHRFIKRIIGNGGIFAPVSIWRRRRKIMVPAFSPKIVESFVEVFSEQSAKLAKRLEDWAGQGTFSIWPFLSTYTLDSVCETAMGVKLNAQGNPDQRLLKSMNTILNLICQRIFHLWLQPDCLYKLFPQYKTHQKCLEVMHGFTDELHDLNGEELNVVESFKYFGHSDLRDEADMRAQRVITKKRDEIKRNGQSCKKGDNSFDLKEYKRNTFLDLLISISGGETGYSDMELREETLTLAIAGTDTSAVCIGFTLKLLAKYPHVQDKVFQELQSVFGDSDRLLVKEDLINLKYLDRVVKESLRLYPPVPFIIRKVEEDITLPSGRVLPAGCGVVVSIWGVHRDPTYWGPDAEKFDPDRFLPERFKLTNSCSYMPFSNGPRNCLGYQYALMSIKTALSNILRRYRIVSDPSGEAAIRVKLDIMMKAVDGYEVGLEKRY